MTTPLVSTPLVSTSVESNRLAVAQLRQLCRPSEIPFETTLDAAGVEGVVGQERAVDALRFGIGIRRQGYHLFAVGPHGVGKQTLLRQFLDRQAAQEQVPVDLCYVNDFTNPARPRLLELPSGMGTKLERDMAHAVSELRAAMRSAFESEERRTRRQQLVARLLERQQNALAEIRDRAQQHDVDVTQTDTGINIAPLREGAIMAPEKFQELPKDEQDRRRIEMERVSEELDALLRKFHEWGHEHIAQLNTVDSEIAGEVARRVLARVRTVNAEQPFVLDFLSQVELDVVENAAEILEAGPATVEAALGRALKHGSLDGAFGQYAINVLIDGSAQSGAPVVHEDNPNYGNLVGRIEHETHFGALVTNFTLIKAGAFHRARGGYLILDALKVLQHPLAWEAVKRTVRSGEIRIESLAQELGLVSTASLDPVPASLGRTKVILTGERTLYYLLAASDPEFLELFKVLVDFEERMDRGPETQTLYANLVATLVRKEALRPFDRTAVARVIEHAARSAGDAEKLSVHMRSVVDVLREADFWAADAGREVVTAQNVELAIDAQLRRSGRVRARVHEAILRGDILIATSGSNIAQVNGLSVFQLGDQLSGYPVRISAQVRLGKGEIVDIEREVKLGGPIHSKGVLSLGAFIGARYATSCPFSLSATLVFEQSYAGVEGDSASLAELCCLLSALAEAPIRQELAVTGSIDQHGRVQSVGAINEKIEGFFDICQQRGLTGAQGVLIPKSNVKNLMLRADLVEAARADRFRIYAIESVDDALELLTNKSAGIREASGRFPEGSVNAAVESRLLSFAEAARTFVAKAPA